MWRETHIPRDICVGSKNSGKHASLLYQSSTPFSSRWRLLIGDYSLSTPWKGSRSALLPVPFLLWKIDGFHRFLIGVKNALHKTSSYSHYNMWTGLDQWTRITDQKIGNNLSWLSSKMSMRTHPLLVYGNARTYPWVALTD